MTNELIDSVLTARDDIREQIDALDAAPKKTRDSLQERLRLLRQLQSVEKQFKAFGKRGKDREAFQIERGAMLFHPWMDVEPERVKEARAFLAKHDPELLRKMDAETRDDEYQEKRMEVVRFMYAEAPDDVQNDMFRRFLVSVTDDAGNLPPWLQRRLGPDLTAKIAGVLAEPVTEP
jgi:chemotaxis protein histidine kinase CheA